jgi:hypothetical protein
MINHNDELEFPWLELFLVTGISFTGFYYFLLLISNYHPPVFLWTGIFLLALGVLASVRSVWKKPGKSNTVIPLEDRIENE